MKRLLNLTYALIISLILIVSALAQPPAKPPEKVVMTQAAPPLKSLTAMPAGEKFTSAEGRFSIALPKDTAEFAALPPNEDAPKETGGSYTWVVKEGVIIVHYSDDPDLVVKTEKDYADMAEGMKAGIAIFSATLLSEKAIKVGEYRGYEIKFENPEKLKGISRMFIAGSRKYMLFYLSSPDVVDATALIGKALDTFALITPAPAPQPQKPSANSKPSEL